MKPLLLTLDSAGNDACLPLLENLCRYMGLLPVGTPAGIGPELCLKLADWSGAGHPVVLGDGSPYFVGPRPRLRLVAHERIGPDAIRLTYVPA